MIITLPYLRAQFDAFNAQLFGGSLAVPRLRISTARRMLGNVRYKHPRQPSRGAAGVSALTLSISKCYDLPQDELDDTIIHEMIHLYIITYNLKDSSTHGRLFRQMMHTINTRYGRHVTISHHGPLAAATPPRQMLIAVVELTDGTLCLLRPTLTRLPAIYRALRQIPAVRTVAWYNTTDEYFASFPRAQTVKLYRAARATVAAKLSTAIALDEVNGRLCPRGRG